MAKRRLTKSQLKRIKAIEAVLADKRRGRCCTGDCRAYSSRHSARVAPPRRASGQWSIATFGSRGSAAVLGLLCVLRRRDQPRPFPLDGDAAVRCAVPGSCRRVHACRARSAVARTCGCRQRPVFGRRSRRGGNCGHATSAKIGTAAQLVGWLLEAAMADRDPPLGRNARRS